MKTLPMSMFRLAMLLLAPAAGAAETNAGPVSGQVAEPRVQRIVIEDDSARIDELRVRGQTQRVVVTPKVGTLRPYEIITGDGSRDLSFSAGSSRGAAGQRVWNVLSF